MDNLTTPSALGIDDEGNSHVSTLDNKPTSFVLKKEATESNFMKAAAELKLLGSSEPTEFPTPRTLNDFRCMDAIVEHIRNYAKDGSDSKADAAGWQNMTEQEFEKLLEQEIATIVDYADKSQRKRKRNGYYARRVTVGSNKSEQQHKKQKLTTCWEHRRKAIERAERELTLQGLKAELRDLIAQGESRTFTKDEKRACEVQIVGLKTTLAQKEREASQERKRPPSPGPHKHVTCPCACRASHTFRQKPIFFEDVVLTDAHSSELPQSATDTANCGIDDLTPAPAVPNRSREEVAEVDIEDKTEQG